MEILSFEVRQRMSEEGRRTEGDITIFMRMEENGQEPIDICEQKQVF